MSEIWLDSSILNTNISLPCYGESHRLDRNRSGGGVLAFVKSNIYCIRRFDLESPNVEVLWLEMCLEKSISFIFGVCYQPPNTNVQSRQQFADAFSNALNLVLNDPDRIVIVQGDFNDLTLDKHINFNLPLSVLCTHTVFSSSYRILHAVIIF